MDYSNLTTDTYNRVRALLCEAPHLLLLDDFKRFDSFLIKADAEVFRQRFCELIISDTDPALMYYESLSRRSEHPLYYPLFADFSYNILIPALNMPESVRKDLKTPPTPEYVKERRSFIERIDTIIDLNSEKSEEPFHFTDSEDELSYDNTYAEDMIASLNSIPGLTVHRGAYAHSGAFEPCDLLSPHSKVFIDNKQAYIVAPPMGADEIEGGLIRHMTSIHEGKLSGNPATDHVITGVRPKIDGLLTYTFAIVADRTIFIHVLPCQEGKQFKYLYLQTNYAFGRGELRGNVIYHESPDYSSPYDLIYELPMHVINLELIYVPWSSPLTNLNNINKGFITDGYIVRYNGRDCKVKAIPTFALEARGNKLYSREGNLYPDLIIQNPLDSRAKFYECAKHTCRRVFPPPKATYRRQTGRSGPSTVKSASGGWTVLFARYDLNEADTDSVIKKCLHGHSIHDFLNHAGKDDLRCWPYPKTQHILPTNLKAIHSVLVCNRGSSSVYARKCCKSNPGAYHYMPFIACLLGYFPVKKKFVIGQYVFKEMPFTDKIDRDRLTFHGICDLLCEAYQRKLLLGRHQ